MSGWIKLHRSMLEWEWYDDINVCRLFIHFLLKANHTPKKWKGIEIGRGQFWTSLDSLEKETNLSSKQIRVAIDKLIGTSDVASKGQSRGRMITVLNYDQYQEEGKLKGKEVAALGQDEGRLGATTKNVKNEDNKDIGPKAKRFSPPTPEDVGVYFLERGHQSAMQEAENFIDFYSAKGWMIGKNKMKDWKAAVRNWMKNDKNFGAKDETSKQLAYDKTFDIKDTSWAD